jgi:uncharacterized membrane protein
LSDSIKRSVIKTVTWRILGTSATLVVSWAITGSWGTASAIALVQIITNTLLYFVHERLWQRR